MWICVCVAVRLASGEDGPKLSKERMVFQTNFGDIEMVFYPEVCGLWRILFDTRQFKEELGLNGEGMTRLGFKHGEVEVQVH